MEEDSLEALIEGARAGDPDAAGEIARRYEDHVRRSIGHKLPPDLRRRIDSEDVFQSTIADSIAALQGFEYEGEKAFLAWLTAVAERRLLEAARRHRAQMRDVGRDRSLTAAAGVSANRTSPSQGAAHAEARWTIRDALARLPDEFRIVAEMRSREGLTFREISERLDLTNADVARDRYRAALKKMGEVLASRKGG